MLWKKESRRFDALYIDILAPVKVHESIQKPHPTKSDEIALEKRNDGNERFRDSAVLKAMELYSDCLRYAQPGSEHISLAYANRSACFLKMKMYDEGLIDIDYALAAGYPEHLRPKLNERKTRCLKEMQENAQHPPEKLSIEPNEMFPCLSNVAKIQRHESGDHSVVAAADIDVGQLIVIEDAYQGYVLHSFGMYCNICTKPFSNLVPCDKCAVAMFCPECQGHLLHEYECGLNSCEDGECKINRETMSLIRGILMALKLFSTADELMVFVEDLLKNPSELPELLLDDRSKYQAFFNTTTKRTVESNEFDQIKNGLSSVYATILRIPDINDMFKATKHQRFLMHLIGHHITIPGFTSGMLMNTAASSTSEAPLFASLLIQSYFKHSCSPNVKFVTQVGKTIAYALKSTKKGEQLFVSLVSSEADSTEKRQTFLWDMLKIKCECLRCLGKAASPAHRQQLVSDPAFRYIDANVGSLQPLVFNSKRVKPLMDACLKVLRKYGRMDWCDELAFVLEWFKTLYNIRSAGGGADFSHPLVREMLMHCDGKCKCRNCKVD